MFPNNSPKKFFNNEMDSLLSVKIWTIPPKNLFLNFNCTFILLPLPIVSSKRVGYWSENDNNTSLKTIKSLLFKWRFFNAWVRWPSILTICSFIKVSTDLVLQKVTVITKPNRNYDNRENILLNFTVNVKWHTTGKV